MKWAAVKCGNFVILNEFFQNKIKFSDTQTQTKTTKLSETQQNFKVLVTNPDAESEWNLGLALVNVTAKAPFLCLFGGFDLKWLLQVQ